MQPPEASDKRQAEVTTPRAHNSSEPEVEMGMERKPLLFAGTTAQSIKKRRERWKNDTIKSGKIHNKRREVKRRGNKKACRMRLKRP